MAIRIEEINAKGLGPLDEFVAKFSKFNLIYGRNEQGKTFLVEFILKSLFKNVKVFRLREINPSGNVLVSGIESESNKFSPTSRMKLEDYWEENIQGMPTNVAQLLVVKGAELDFIDNVPSGVSKNVVKSFLSSERTLDQIQGKIQATVRDAQIENGEIIGACRGELRSRDNIRNELNQIDNLLHEVNQDYSGGTLTALLDKQKEMQEKKLNQENAKRYLAYTHSKSIQELEENNRFLDRQGLQDLIDNNNELNRKTNELQRESDKLEDAKDKSKHYEWVSSAIEEYEKILNQGITPFKRGTFILSASLITLAAFLTGLGFLLYLLDLATVAAILFCVVGIVILLGMVFGILFYRQQQKRESLLIQSHELERIETTYLEYFGEKLTDIAALKTKQQSIQKDYYESQRLGQVISDLESDIDLLKTNIDNGFEKIGISSENESMWMELITEQEEIYSNNEKEIQELRITLANLNVEPDEYIENDPQIQYEKAELTRINHELDDVQIKIRDEEDNLGTLKTKILSAIPGQTFTSWEKLLENLRQHRLQLLESYREITSKILAGITVTQVIQEAREQEDEKLKIVLCSPTVQKPLFDITKRYKEIICEEEKIRISDGFEEFDIANLSTAAREQVLLALRIGFAARIMNQETAFLILDDAFQHSDWLRREYMLDTVISLAKNGWQIIYFTMDDHIRDLFIQEGKRHFKDEYQYYDLQMNSQFV